MQWFESTLKFAASVRLKKEAFADWNVKHFGCGVVRAIFPIFS